PPENASPEALRACLEVGGDQVRNLPLDIKTLVVAFGSGNTTAGILYGLHKYGALEQLDRIVLVGVGPDRMACHGERQEKAGVNTEDLAPRVDHQPLHGWSAEYADLMPETIDGIVRHPTYEGEVVRYLNSAKPEWWTS